MLSIKEILKEFNELDEHSHLEAKRCDKELGSSFYETVCAFANEPHAEGGVIVLGVSQTEEDLFSTFYEVTGVQHLDKINNDIITGCADKFNIPVRPTLESEEVGGKVVIKVRIDELAESAKPLFLKNKGLPRGAYRRIGASDVKCNEDDLSLFYQSRNQESYEAKLYPDLTIDAFDQDAIDHYRKLCLKAKPNSEVADWEDIELLDAVSAVKKKNGSYLPTLLGLLLFGSRLTYRRELPTVKIDYIRVAGHQWIDDAEERFTHTIDLRGPLLQVVDRAVATIMDDLPKGFHLPEGQIQAETPTLPAKAIREAVVNAVMHRSYREHRPTQIIRYANRLEITNSGYSLKNEDLIGQPGSELRNPHLSEIFFETNTAERKGSGMRTMRKLMRDFGYSPPTFESSRENNNFTIRFLLQHFLTQSDLAWLECIPHELSQHQKVALVFVREQGAVDNKSLRQLTDCDVLNASKELRKLRDYNLLKQKGGGRATYYIPNEEIEAFKDEVGCETSEVGSKTPELGCETSELGRETIPSQVKVTLAGITNRSRETDVKEAIIALCHWKPQSASNIAKYLARKHTKALKRNYLSKMLGKELVYLYPDMENHPEQAYQINPDWNELEN